MYALGNLQGSGAQSDQDVIAAVAAKQIVLYWLVVTVSAAADVQVTVGADAAATRLVDGYFGANGGISREWPSHDPFILPTATALKVTSSAGNIRVTAHYRLKG